MLKVLGLVWVMLMLAVGAGRVAAQESWIQIEARPSLTDAQARAREWGARFPDVAGFRLPSGWYAIVLGPQEAGAAAARMGELKAQRAIPADSYLARSRDFAARFWPAGQPEGGVATSSPAVLPPASVPVAPPVVSDETPAEARRIEAALAAEDRQDIQRALTWAGVYEGAIDGAIGAGSRAAISAWQAGRGLAQTGVLTSRQRQDLVGGWKGDVEALGLRVVADRGAGIELPVPGALVEFSRYEPPFAVYAPREGSDVRLWLVSAPARGGLPEELVSRVRALLPGVVEETPRADGFTLTGVDEGRRGHGEVTLSGGAARGFALVWPDADEARMVPLLRAMRTGVRLIGTRVLDTTRQSEAARAGMLSGLDKEGPKAASSGFYVDGQGAVLTLSATVGGCGRILIDGRTPARVVAEDGAAGLAVLRPDHPLAPMAHAAFAATLPHPGAEVAVSGYSWSGRLTRPVASFGHFADPRGLEDERDIARLELRLLPGDAGGPVLDHAGAVVGVALPRLTEADRRLPEDVAFARPVAAFAALLERAGVRGDPVAPGPALAPEDMARLGERMTVLVTCAE